MRCLNPTTLKTGLIVPCKKCPPCRMASRYAWAFRLYQETKVHTNTLFVTLTYNNENVPNKVYDSTHLHRYRCHNNFMTLSKQDTSLFIKNIQKQVKRIGGKTALFRYYLIGEYGDKDQSLGHNKDRPHYHALLFIPNNVTKEQAIDIVNNCWSYGGAVIEDVSDANINYLGKHQLKESLGNCYQQKFAPIFSKMSRYNGGLGINYLSESVKRFHLSSKEKNSYVISFGYRQPLPSFYRKLIWTENLTESEMTDLIQKNFDQNEEWYRSYGRTQVNGKVRYLPVNRTICEQHRREEIQKLIYLRKKRIKTKQYVIDRQNQN